MKDTDMMRKPHPLECEDVEQANAGAVVKTELCKSTERRYVEQLKAKDARIAELEARCAAYEKAIQYARDYIEGDRSEYPDMVRTSLGHIDFLMSPAKAKGQGEGGSDE